MGRRASLEHTTLAIVVMAALAHGNAFAAAGDDCRIEANTGLSACGDQNFQGAVNVGVPFEKYEELSNKHNVTKEAFAAWVTMLGLEHLPGSNLEVELKKFDSKLRMFVTEYHQLKAEVAATASETPEVAALANDALERGNLSRARKLLAVARDQVYAVRLIGTHQPKQALQELQKSEQRLNELLNEDPSSIQIKTQLGYIYKTYTQAFTALTDDVKANWYLDQALDIFEQIKDELGPGEKTVEDLANAANGIGNIYFQRGEYSKAIGSFELATELVPHYAYAWHDMFLAYFALAKRGEVDLEPMQNALNQLKQTGLGWPGLDPGYIAGLDEAFSSITEKKR